MRYWTGLYAEVDREMLINGVNTMLRVATEILTSKRKRILAEWSSWKEIINRMMIGKRRLKEGRAVWTVDFFAVNL